MTDYCDRQWLFSFTRIIMVGFMNSVKNNIQIKATGRCGRILSIRTKILDAMIIIIIGERMQLL